MGKRGKHKHKGRPPFAAAPAAAAAPPSPAAAGVDADVEIDAQADAQAEVQASGAEALEASGITATEAPSAPDAEAGEAAPIAPARVPVRPARLLRSPFLALADYEQRSLAHVAGLPEQLDAPGLWRGVAYRVGRHRLASGFDEVVEILPLPALTHVPGALPWLLGIANIRGSLLPVVDLKQFLEGERTVLHERQRVLVVRQPGGDVAVTIDELYGQRSFIEAQAIDASALMDGRYAHFVERAYRMNDQDWGVFSLERLSRTPEFRQAAA
jgi:twitching motility protein PilI